MGIKSFIASVHVDGHYTTEDPKCPSYWRGSGCYDIDVPVWMDLEVEVWADSFGEVEEMLEEFDYAQGSCVYVDGVDILSIKFNKYLKDRDKEEKGVDLGLVLDWKEHYYDD